MIIDKDILLLIGRNITGFIFSTSNAFNYFQAQQDFTRCAFDTPRYKDEITVEYRVKIPPETYSRSKKQNYRGMFETQKSGNKTSSGEIGLNIRTLSSPKLGQDQVSGGVSVLCWHAAPVANVLWKPLAIR